MRMESLEMKKSKSLIKGSFLIDRHLQGKLLNEDWRKNNNIPIVNNYKLRFRCGGQSYYVPSIQCRVAYNGFFPLISSASSLKFAKIVV